MSTIHSPAMRPQGYGFEHQQPPISTFQLPRRIFVGSFVTSETKTKLRIIKRGLIGVGSSGVIRFVEDLDELEKEKHTLTSSILEDERSSTPVNVPNKNQDSWNHGGQANLLTNDDLTLPPPLMNGSGFISDQYKDEQMLIERAVEKHGWRIRDCETVMLDKDSFLTPGFIDTHIHAPQVPNLGLGQQYELLDWLENVTFPRERKFEDPMYARKTYEQVVQRMLDCGTTCAAIYATLHEEATMILAQICNDKGMRAFVGKCQMDRNSPVEYKEKNSAASMESTKKFINFCRNMPPFGTPKNDITESFDPMSSSGSIEMDQSIARLTATMDGIMNGSSKEEEKGDLVDSPEALRPSTLGSSVDSHGTSEKSYSSTQATSIAPNSFDHNGDSIDSQHKSTVAMSVRSNSSHGYEPSKRSSLSNVFSASGSGTGTPKRMENSNALVQPILTPRFAISCSDALLASISALMSRDATLRVQTHISENPTEIEFTKSLFPFCETYTDVYDHFSLLTPRTILAHAIHLSDEEMDLIAKRKCGISHCPTSNLNLRSGASPLGELLNKGIKVGLGTDMSGGFGMSILSAIRDASIVAKVIQFTDRHNEKKGVGQDSIKSDQHDFCKGPLPLATLFYLATMGGAEVCNVDNKVGSLDVGKEFDAILFNCENSNPNLFINQDDRLEQKLEKILFCGDDRNIASVFVRGRVVGGSAPIG